jgi:type IV fimbrial biogenesis protein FimT
MYRNKGLTLMEVMIAIAILGIITSLAASSFNNLIRRQQVSGETNVLFSLIYYARSEAVKHNKVVTICKSDDVTQCGGDWSDGWIVFTDDDKDGSRDNGETIISSGKIGEGYKLAWSAFGSNSYIRFTPNGLTLSQNGTFKICPLDGNVKFARAVVISKTARVRLPKDSDGNGIYEDSSHNDLTCN